MGEQCAPEMLVEAEDVMPLWLVASDSLSGLGLRFALALAKK